MEKKLTVADLKVGMKFETVHGGEPRALVRNFDGSYAAVCPATGRTGGTFRTLEDLLFRFNGYGVYRLRPEPESKRVFIAGMKFMCEKPSDRQLVQFGKEENFTIINPNTGAGVWRDITPAQLSRLFDDKFYSFNPSRPITMEAELAAGYGAQQQCSPEPAPTDTIELRFANGTTVTVAVK